MQKGFAVPLLLIGILIILGSILGFTYFVKSSKDRNTPLAVEVLNPKKEGLKSYNNQILGFDFQYPDNLQVKEDSEEEFNKRGGGDFRKNFTYYITYPPAKVLGAIVVLDETGSYETNPFSVWVFDNLGNLTIDRWSEKYWYYPFLWGDFDVTKHKVAPHKQATVSGQMAQYSVVDYRPGLPKFIYIKNSEKMYLLRLINDSQNSADKILESFKLLE